MRFAGILPAVITPFTTDDRVDVAALRANAEAVLAGGAAGLVATGTMGEAGSLTDDERRTVIEACVAVAGERPVVVGVSSGSTVASAGYAAMARECGAQGLMCLPPQNYDGDAREIAAHFRAVAAAGGLPVMAYNNPEASGIDLTPEKIVALAEAVPEVVAVKECSGDARRIAALVNDTDLDILVGGDDWALEGYAAGAVGWVSGVANVAPAECAELQTLIAEGRLEEARALYRRLLPLSRLDMTPKLVQYFKGAMDAVGHRGGPTRPPRLPLTEAERDVLHAAVAALREPALA